MDAGMNAVVYCGSMGDWPLLTTQQRQDGVKCLVDAGVRVVVGTGAQNPGQAAGHARHAQQHLTAEVRRNKNGGHPTIEEMKIQNT